MARPNLKKSAELAASEAKNAAKTPGKIGKEFVGPSPDPKTNLLLADIALRGGSMLLRRSVELGLLGIRNSPAKAKRIMKSRTIGETLLSTAVARVATRSVPGAILVGGGMLAKTLYDRRKKKQAEREGSDYTPETEGLERKPHD